MSEPNPRSAALDFLRPYVHRGDDERSLRLSHMGEYSHRFKISIGGYVDVTEYERHYYPPTKVIVYQLGDHRLNPAVVIDLHSLYAQLRQELVQPSLLTEGNTR